MGHALGHRIHDRNLPRYFVVLLAGLHRSIGSRLQIEIGQNAEIYDTAVMN